MHELCGNDCCAVCPLFHTRCAGCAETNGHPCGGSCVAAECVSRGGQEEMLSMKQALMDELNALALPGLTIKELYLLSGSYVNLAYPLPSGEAVRFLRDDRTYWGTQVEKSGSDRCYGAVGDESFLLVSEYGCQGADPEIIRFIRRK